MRTSIALCTWNGAAFLEQQLGSLAAQTRMPDELVICDDASGDGTLAIIEAFASHAPFPVRLHRNPTRLGTKRNFEQAMARCTGDLIFLCDQDDVWHPGKIASMSNAFERDGDLGCLFTDARQIDEKGNPLEHSLWDHIGFALRERQRVRSGRAFDVLVEHNVVTGATMAFRARWRESILPIGEAPDMLHDQWIALLLSAIAKLSCVDAQLVDYRQHAAQQVGVGAAAGGVRRWVAAARDTGAEEYAVHAAQLEAALQRLEAIGAPSTRLDELRGRIAHLRMRASLSPRRLARVGAVMRELASLRYHRYSNHFWSAAKDLFWS